VSDTLLGPEETGQEDRGATRCGFAWWPDPCWSFRLIQDHAGPSEFSGGLGGCCLLFEICIVDASIFVAKFFRAHGGCLGIRSR
jgi:hypothetical protein